MELPSICFKFPYIFISFFIILHIVIFFLIIKFIPNVEKLPFLWGMITWTIAIAVVFYGFGIFIPSDSDSLKILRAILGGIIPPITEDIGRLIVFTFIYKSKNHNFNNSLIFGAGHGGWESIVLMSINQITNLVNFYTIKNYKDEEELIKNNLLKIYNKYKNGITGEEILGVILRFGGNLFHMAASVIIYRLSLNRKKKIYYLFYNFIFKSFFRGYIWPIFHFI